MSKTPSDKRALFWLREVTKGNKVYLKRWPTNKSQLWIYREEIGKSIPRSFLVGKAMGRSTKIINKSGVPKQNQMTVMTQ